MKKLVKEGKYAFKNYDKLMHIVAYENESYYSLDLSEITFTLKENMNHYLYGKVRADDILAGKFSLLKRCHLLTLS